MKTGISLITMGAGNVIVLEETLKSFKNICDEVIFGDLILFPEDRQILYLYEKEYNMKIIQYPFDFIFKNGFSAILNDLASHASNDMVLYMNLSEVIEIDYGIVDIVNKNKDCNTFYFTHATDKHHWYRMNNRKELKWSGLIHEESVGNHKPYHKPIFQMKDLEKDLMNPFKAQVLNDVKEICYFTQYNRIIDEPALLGGTDPGWIPFAEGNYESMAFRLRKKGARYEAFKKGSFEAYMNAVYTDPEFSKERFESSSAIAFQGDKIHLL